MNHQKIHLNLPGLFTSTVASGLIAVLLAGCGASAEKSDKEKDAVVASPPTIEVFPAQRAKLSTALHIPGELISFQQVDLYARENSFVKKIYVDVGSEVSEGQLLATLEAPELTSRLNGASSRQKSQEAVYHASKANYERLLETSKTPGTISQNDLDQAQAKMNSDYEQLASATAAQSEVLNTRNYLEIRAPFQGVISARNVNPGANVGPSGKGSEKPMFVLQEQQHMRLVVSVPEAFTSYLATGNDVSFKVRARSNELFHATITRHAGALDTRLRAERVEMDVVNKNKKLLPGMIADVVIPLAGIDSTFVVPKSAVVNAAESIFVIRIKNNTVEWVDVELGRSADGKIEVYGNLSPGDQLVRVASEEIRNGAAASNVKEVSLAKPTASK
ncbi:efflux RND transporter periplasmic adaptor subunit [Chryseolinea lacunae]|uniref:Efflux RND transporter periplasmic adaptor subunit n=1 Tax=Chryseolinea lacunae TaxID=2801331 RepID=A0ABS1KXQ6_9BACT|nr:efflux RND transporter periplasmic adaptor subunit [Chryseolinea lacunae]MBL0744012.1 efflux RND transporter periplasmic adaptor subunit [Chryseolinea lacunae]